jgi:membrane protease YdiL (CAAX protease family)
MGKYILLMALISIIPSFLIVLIVSSLVAPVDASGDDMLRFGHREPVTLFVLLVFVGPLLETLLMSLVIWLLSLRMRSGLAIAVTSAVIWAALHSLADPPWGLTVLWPFLIFSCAYITWLRKSWAAAIWVTMCIHALQNLLPAICIVILAVMSPTEQRKLDGFRTIVLENSMPWIKQAEVLDIQRWEHFTQSPKRLG